MWSRSYSSIATFLFQIHLLRILIELSFCKLWTQVFFKNLILKRKFICNAFRYFPPKVLSIHVLSLVHKTAGIPNFLYEIAHISNKIVRVFNSLNLVIIIDQIISSLHGLNFVFQYLRGPLFKKLWQPITTHQFSFFSYRLLERRNSKWSVTVTAGF